MSRDNELEAMTLAISQKHKPLLMIREVAEILGKNEEGTRKLIREAGVLVQVSGKRKLITAYGVAQIMCHGRVPITRERA